jgi:hypothetical protein
MHHSLILQEVLRMQIDMLSLRSFEERLNSSNMHVSLFVAGVHQAATVLASRIMLKGGRGAPLELQLGGERK